MTCQVVLLNGWGIGLASDSAVTSGNRVSNGSEKIFALPSPHKIAILTSANARIMGLPWESVLSAWSESLTKVLPEVNDYWSSLEKWICNAISSTTSITDHEFEYLENRVYRGLRKTLVDEVWHPVLKPFLEKKLTEQEMEIASTELNWQPEFKKKIETLIPKEVAKQSLDVIRNLNKYRQENHDASDGTNMGQCLVWIERYIKDYPNKFETSFFADLLSDLPDFPGLQEVLTEYGASLLAFPNWDAGTVLCVTGFGENDLLPSALEVNVLGIIGGVRLGSEVSSWVRVKDSAHLFYGQRDALESLVLGRDSILLDASAKQSEAVSMFRAELEVSETDNTAVAHIKEAFENTIAKNNLEDQVISAGKEERLQPFQKAVSMSPVRDLAEFASTLVGVQSARAAFSQDNPTVGGPIDVATITKHEGFVWLRHK
jgi:hypothetical protein